MALVGSGSFYAGIAYSRSKDPATGSDTRQARFLQTGGGMRGMRDNGGLAIGQVIAKDEKSVTIKLRSPGRNPEGTSGEGAGSKIVLLSDSTQVTKAVAGSPKDVSVGQEVTVTGTPNTDGSISAQTVQIRPIPLEPRTPR